MRQGKLVTSALLAAALLLGCNGPSQPNLSQPRVVVHYGNMELAPNADLAIVLDVRALLGEGYKVQQAASSSVQTITAKVTGPNLAEPVTTSVNLIDCTNGIATLNFSSLPPGPVDVVVNAIDFGGQVVSWAAGKAVIKPNQTAQVTLRCSTATGGLTIDFDCPELCGGSATPSPVPTPVPSPTPTPSPANPLKENVLSIVSTIEADARGNLYLFGGDPSPVPTTNQGRIVKVNASTLKSSLAYDDVDSMQSMQIVGDTLTIFARRATGSVAEDWVKLDVSGDQPVKTAAIDLPLYTYANWLLTKDQNDSLLFVGAAPPYFSIFSETDMKKPLYPFNDHTLNNGVMPRNLSFDYETNRPVWSCSIGICTVGDTPNVPKVIYDADNNPTTMTRVPYGITHTGPNSPYFLYSTLSENKVFVFDKANPTAVIEAKDFSPHRPRIIRRGPDGYYYVLLFSMNPPERNGYWPYHDRYKVIKCSLGADRKLTELQTLVDTTGI